MNFGVQSFAVCKITWCEYECMIFRHYSKWIGSGLVYRIVLMGSPLYHNCFGNYFLRFPFFTCTHIMGWNDQIAPFTSFSPHLTTVKKNLILENSFLTQAVMESILYISESLFQKTYFRIYFMYLKNFILKILLRKYYPITESVSECIS